MICGIYKITNNINQKCYIGQSVNIERRWREERAAANSPSDLEYDCPRSRAFRKYGLENFSFEILEQCEVSQLNSREGYWAKFYNSYTPTGYNVAQCGENHFHFNKLDREQFLSLVDDLMNTWIPEKQLALKYGISLDNVSKINMGSRCKIDELSYPLRIHNKTKRNRCVICGKIIDHKATYCTECSAKMKRTVERPSRKQLLMEIANSSFVKVGMKYGVSDKAIVKWCRAYGLPEHKKELVDLYKKEKENS